MWRDAVRGFSLANLCLMYNWLRLYELNRPTTSYYLDNADFRKAAIVQVLLVLLLGAVFTGTARFVRKIDSPRLYTLASLVFLGVLLIPFYGLTMDIRTRNAYGAYIILIVICAVVGRSVRGAARCGGAALQIFAPFAFVTFGLAGRAFLGSAASVPASASPVPDMEPKGAPIVWLIFDCWDYRLTFDARPPSVKLPELDRLRKESFFATQDFPPSRRSLVSLPALFIGDAFADANPSSASELVLTKLDGKNLNFSEVPNIFSKAREIGAETEIIGWYHPYDRVIGRSLDEKYIHRNTVPEYTHYLHNLESPVTSLLTMLPYVRKYVMYAPVNNLVWESFTAKVDGYNADLAESQRAINDKTLDLLVIHWTIPHPAAIYWRTTNYLGRKRGASYLDNLALVDRTIGDIKRMLKESGKWDKCALIATSDHWWRSRMWRRRWTFTPEEQAVDFDEADKRVPLIIKMPGQTKGLSYPTPVNNMCLAPLALAILNGELRSADQLPGWLSKHPTPILQPVPDPKSSKLAAPDVG